MKGGMGSLLKQAQKISENIAKVQAELEAQEVESSVGGGMVKVVANGQQEILRTWRCLRTYWWRASTKH
jgi:DNA-binding protein YbaB